MRQRVDLYALCLNEARLIPYFFKHYTSLVDRFFILDNGSTDGSLGLLRGDERVTVRSFETLGDSFVEHACELLNSVWKASRAEADWVIVAEIDEHLHHEDLRAYLSYSALMDVTAIRAIGYNMISKAFPTDPAPLWQQVTRGARSRDFDKLAIFRPDALDETNFRAGRHSDAPTGRVVYEPHPQVKLLHFKCLGTDYICERNATLAGGMRSRDVSNLWGAHYQRERHVVEADMRDLGYWARRVPGLHGVVTTPLDLTWDDECSLIERSGLFNADAYARVYLDVAASRVEPLRHFCSYGWREGRRPNRHFDPRWYAARYAAFMPPEVNPLLEYIVAGERAGRMPVPYFDPALYRHQTGLGLDDSPLRALLETEPDPLTPPAVLLVRAGGDPTP